MLISSSNLLAELITFLPFCSGNRDPQNHNMEHHILYVLYNQWWCLRHKVSIFFWDISEWARVDNVFAITYYYDFHAINKLDLIIALNKSCIILMKLSHQPHQHKWVGGLNFHCILLTALKLLIWFQYKNGQLRQKIVSVFTTDPFLPWIFLMPTEKHHLKF